MKTIYFDYNATTPLDPAVRDAMLPFLNGVWGNPSSVHHVGRKARALLDIRFPPGMTAWEIHGLVTAALESHPMVACQLLDHADPTWTNPEHELAGLVRKNAAEILGHPPAATIRAGFSDARFYRERGIPSIGYGVTAHNGGAPDEYVEIEDLWAVCAVHTLTALDYLSAPA